MMQTRGDSLEVESLGSMAKGEGRNTKFFHRSMIQKRYTNHITKIEDSQGNTLLEHVDIEDKIITYYKELLSDPLFDITPAIKRIIQHIPTLITTDQNKSLMRPITQEEVDQAIKEIPPGKA
jgi:hypothetical protein